MLTKEKTYFYFVRKQYISFLLVTITYIVSRYVSIYFGGSPGVQPTLTSFLGIGIVMVFFSAYVRFRKN